MYYIYVLQSLKDKNFYVGYTNNLKKRKTEDSEDINLRIERVKEEYELSKHYDYVIENKVLDEAVQRVTEIIKENLFSRQK